MRRITIMTLLIMAFVSFATVDSFADNSPPGVEISIDYEAPEGVNLNVEIQVAQVWQAIELNNHEGRIAVYDCDLKCWPGNIETFNVHTISTISDLGIIREANNINTDFIWAELPENNIDIPKNQHNENRFKSEVLSMFENSYILNRSKKLATG